LAVLGFRLIYPILNISFKLGGSPIFAIFINKNLH
jgi:hypothetical protein